MPRFAKLAEVQSHLQTIADTKGKASYDAFAKAYMADVCVVDEDGVTPLAADSYSIEVKHAEPASEAATPDSIAKTVADGIAAGVSKSLEAAKHAMNAKAAAFAAPSKLDVSVGYGHSKAFKGLSGRTQREADQQAYTTGKWFQAICGVRSAQQWCSDRGIAIEKGFWSGNEFQKGHIEGSNSLGGFLVPEQVDDAIIDLKETYGVFRQHARRSVMTGDTKSRRRRTGGLTAYFVSEAAAGTESTKSWDRVNLTAKKVMALGTFSNELGEDATINVGDDISLEIAYAFTYKEDLCGFIGDGTSTYGGIVGLANAFTANGGTSNLGVQDGTGSTWSGLVLSDFNALTGKLPVFARNANTRWYCSAPFYSSVMESLMYASGGVTVTEIMNGIPTPMFLGYPVVIAQALPSATATGYHCFLGDLSLAADFGDRRGTTIAFSDSALNAFEQDEIAYRGTSRFDVNVHDVGSTSAAGPLVAMYIG